MTRSPLLFLILVTTLLSVLHASDEECYSKSVEEPLVEKPGDYIVVGIFNIGQVDEVLNEDTNTTELNCVVSHTDRLSFSYWSLQRAIAFAEIIRDFQLPGGYKLGYKIYTGCNSIVVSRLVSRAISLDDRVIGALLPGYKLHVEPVAGLITAYNIPAITYIYADNDLMDKENYPTMITLLDTEKNEAESIIRYLEKQNHRFIDIWYHAFSQEVAEHIFNEYVRKVGCGRINEYTTSKGMDINVVLPPVYNNSTVKPSKVQLLLFNNRISGKNFLKLAVNELEWNNTVFLFGYSNGRDSYIDSYLEVIKPNSTVTNIMVFLGSDFMNVKLKDLSPKLANPTLFQGINDTLVSMYTEIKELKGYTTQKTSWLGYSMSGTSIIVQALNAVLKRATQYDCPAELRQRIFESLITGNYTVSLDGDELSIKFVDRSYSKGYAVKAVWVRGNSSNSTFIGYSSHLGLQLINNRFPEDLVSKPEQQTCSETCPPGTARDFQDVVNLPCCWDCLVCPIHYANNRSNQNKCTECGPYETNSEDSTGCEPVGKEFLRITSSYVILGLICSVINLIILVSVIALCVKMATRPVIKAADPAFLITFLLGLVFGDFGLMFTLMKPSHTVCQAEFILNVVFFTLVTSSLDLRSMKIYTIFSAANNFRKPKFRVLCTRKGQMIMNTCILVINSLITIAVVEITDAWKFDLVQEQLHTRQYVMCISGSWFTILPFVIPGILFLQTLYFAFVMRNFPHNFRETTSIFAATLTAIFSSAMFLTGYELSPPKNKSILRAIMIYITVIVFLAAILGPKFVVLFRFNRNPTDERDEISATLHNYCNSKRSVRQFKSAIPVIIGPNHDSPAGNGTKDASLSISSDSQYQVKEVSVQGSRSSDSPKDPYQLTIV